MIARLPLFLLLLSITVASAQPITPIRKSIETSQRAIRRDVPMTNSIRKAFQAGTQDFTGTPGPN